MLAVYYISGHGLGHASRSIELIEALTRRCRDLRIVIRTSAHAWAFDRIRGPRVDLRPMTTDPGVVQIDSLRLDEDETAKRAAEFYGELDRHRVPATTGRGARHQRHSTAGHCCRRSGWDSLDRRRQLHVGLDLRLLPPV
jgi:hypothetical protein